MTAKQLKSEVALRCADPEFKDFEPAIYDRAIYRCNREIAKYYGIFRKILAFTLSDMTDSIENQVILEIPDFKGEFLVSVNGINLVKVAGQIQPEYRGVYFLEFRDGQYYFDYSMGLTNVAQGVNITGQDITETMSHSLFERIEEGETSTQIYKSLDDEITICYNIIPDIDTEIGEYDIPSKYEEEQIERAVYYMAKLGLVKYSPDTEKHIKYKNLIELNKMDNRSEYDKILAEDREWIKIYPWSVV